VGGGVGLCVRACKHSSMRQKSRPKNQPQPLRTQLPLPHNQTKPKRARAHAHPKRSGSNSLASVKPWWHAETMSGMMNAPLGAT
jgi:hypothetical protein